MSFLLLVIGCWLLVIGYWLLVVGCWLLVIGCWLLVVGEPESIYRGFPSIDSIGGIPDAARPMLR